MISEPGHVYFQFVALNDYCFIQLSEQWMICFDLTINQNFNQDLVTRFPELLLSYSQSVSFEDMFDLMSHSFRLLKEASHGIFT